MAQYAISGGSASAIAESVEAAVAAGALRPGETLPSVRRLARELGVSPTTVAAAIRELARRGVVIARPRRGAHVSARPPLATPPPPPVPAGVLDLADGNPDPALLPDLEGALRRLRVPARLYGEPQHLPELLALGRRDLPRGALAVVGGALDGVERALAARLRPGDRVAVEDPGYAAIADLVRAMGLVPVPVAVDGRGPRPDALAGALRGGVDAVLVTPRAQNPTGAALDARRAAELRRVLREAPDVLVVEDDHAASIAGAPAYSLAAGRARWAHARSLTKSLGPDLRVALLAGDPTTVARVSGRQAHGAGWVSHVLQRLAAGLLADARTTALLERAERTYARRRAALLAALAGRGIEAAGRSGLNVWIPVADETAVVQALLERGYAVAAGARFRLASPPAIRVTTARLEPAQARRLAAALAGVLRTGPAARAA